MLTSKQRAYLTSLAQPMKPIIQIGKNGLNDPIKTSVRQALDARELIKITLLQNTNEQVRDVADTLKTEIGCEVVRTIGRVAILYKISSKPENQKLSARVKAL